MKFTEAKLELAIIDFLGQKGFPHVLAQDIACELKTLGKTSTKAE